jgi:hypothetical protein
MITGDIINGGGSVDSGGGSSGGSSGGSTFTQPDEVDFSDTIYFYFGWLKDDGSYSIERQKRSDSSSEHKTGAWASRVTLW